MLVTSFHNYDVDVIIAAQELQIAFSNSCMNITCHRNKKVHYCIPLNFYNGHVIAVINQKGGSEPLSHFFVAFEVWHIAL